MAISARLQAGFGSRYLARMPGRRWTSGRPLSAGEVGTLWVIGAHDCIESSRIHQATHAILQIKINARTAQQPRNRRAGLEQLCIAALRGNLETKRTRTQGGLDLSRCERPVAAAPRVRAFALLRHHFINLGPARC